MKKKILLLAVAMLLTAASALAQGGTAGPLTWNLDNGTLTISGEGAMPDYEIFSDIPWWEYRESIYTIVIEAGVTTIGNVAFIRCSNLTLITIPNSITNIGLYAFRECGNLISITIPDGVITIERGTFLSCLSLTSVTIPNSITTIGAFAFAYCHGLTSVTIPESVTTIGDDAFSSCLSLTSIIIPNSVTSIGEWAFVNCYALTSATLSNSITDIKEGAFDCCQSLTSITIPSGVTTIGRQAFGSCDNLISVTIPNSVTTIGINAFSECISLSSITIPNSVTTIGGGAFSFCFSLASVTLSNSLTAIGDRVFGYCRSLSSITIPNSVTKIGDAAFSYCISLASVTFPNSLTAIGRAAFAACTSLTSITIPSSVTNIGEYAFAECTRLPSIEVESANNHYISDKGILFTKDKTTLICCPAGRIEPSYMIPAGVTKIMNGAFSGCANLTSIEVESENNYYVSEDGSLFNKDKTMLFCYPIGKTETSYTIPNTVTTVGYDAFHLSPNLTSVAIPNSVTRIGERAFSYCTALTSIIIPKAVKNIEYAAFYYSENLTSITNLNPMPVKIDGTVFWWGGKPQNTCTLKVPTSAVSAYQNAAEWSKFKIIGGGILVDPVASNSKYGYTTGDGLYEMDETATVTATARDGYKFVRWTKDGSEVSMNDTYSFFVTEDVELVAHFEVAVGIGELTIENGELKIYPNPASDIVTISATTEIEQLHIFDLTGRLINSQLPANSQVVFDTGVLPKGIYLVQVRLKDGGVQTGKVVVN